MNGSVRRTLMTMILAAAALMGAGAQNVEQLLQPTARLVRSSVWSLDTLQMDSLYDHWNAYAEAHPKDEQAWRNLFEVNRERSTHFQGRMEESRAYTQRTNVVGRMEQAIPESYTFYYCAYEGHYEFQKMKSPHRGAAGGLAEAPYDMASYIRARNQFADRAIELLPDDALAYDYELWASYLIREKAGEDSTQLTRLLTRYFDSGLYPAEELQYHFNELQGMDEGAIYIGATEGDITGKLILQLVMGVHRDKLLYNDNCASYRPYLEAFFRSAGLSQDFFDPEGEWAKTEEQFEEQRLNIRYICQHAQRPVYFSASSLSHLIVGEGLPDDLKACLYNEGLTMRYSAKPYDNLAAKRRNVEERYRLEYLRLSFRPSEERDDTRRFRQSTGFLAFNYLLLLNDLMPYYKAHSPGRYAWLNSLFTDVLAQMVKKNVGGYGCDAGMFYIKEVTEGGLHYEVTREPIIQLEDGVKFDKKQRQLLIKTVPVTTTNYSNYTSSK